MINQSQQKTSILTTNIDKDVPVDTVISVFEELDIEVSKKEISNAISRLP